MSDIQEPERRAQPSRKSERIRTAIGVVLAFAGVALFFTDRDVTGAIALGSGCLMIVPEVFLPVVNKVLDNLPALRKPA